MPANSINKLNHEGSFYKKKLFLAAPGWAAVTLLKNIHFVITHKQKRYQEIGITFIQNNFANLIFNFNLRFSFVRSKEKIILDGIYWKMAAMILLSENNFTALFILYLLPLLILIYIFLSRRLLIFLSS